MKTPNVTRLLIGTLPGERKPDHALARRQISAGTKPSSKAQAAAELAGFKRNIDKMSTRQLKDLHARLSKRLGKVALAKIMSEAKAK
jgi:BRCT domain type II-containing protein